MKIQNPIQDYAESVMRALVTDLPDITYESRRPGSTPDQTETKQPRPDFRDLRDIRSFIETWSSTALGFGGMGGAAMSDALTVVILCGNTIAVYWQGRLGYTMPITGGVADFMEEMQKGRTLSRHDAWKRGWPISFPDMEQWIEHWGKK